MDTVLCRGPDDPSLIPPILELPPSLGDSSFLSDAPEAKAQISMSCPDFTGRCGSHARLLRRPLPTRAQRSCPGLRWTSMARVHAVGPGAHLPTVFSTWVF